MAKITTLHSHHPAHHLVFPGANVHTSVATGLNAYLCTHKRLSYCTHTHIQQCSWNCQRAINLFMSHRVVQLPVLWNKDTTHSHSTVTRSQTSPLRMNLSHFCPLLSSLCRFSWWIISGLGRKEKSRFSKQEQHMSANLFHETLEEGVVFGSK